MCKCRNKSTVKKVTNKTVPILKSVGGSSTLIAVEKKVTPMKKITREQLLEQLKKRSSKN